MLVWLPDDNETGGRPDVTTRPSLHQLIDIETKAVAKLLDKGGGEDQSHALRVILSRVYIAGVRAGAIGATLKNTKTEKESVSSPT